MSDMGIVILAAGKGTRLSLPTSKPLAPLQSKKLIDFPLCRLKGFTDSLKISSSIAVVTGHDRENLESYLKDHYTDLSFAFQEKQNGTAGALEAYLEQCDFAKKTTYTLIACADTPCLLQEDLEKLYHELSNHDYDAVAASFHKEKPKGYGRILRSSKGFKIVEEKEASEEQKKVTEVNSGLYIVKTEYLLQQLKKVHADNKSGEFYLTDIFQSDAHVQAILFESSQSFIGVNTNEHLQEAEQILRKQKNALLTKGGVRLMDPSSTYVDMDVQIGTGTSLAPNCYLIGKTIIEENVEIEAGCWLKNSHIGAQSKILSYSHLEDVIVKSDVSIGPFARLRPGSLIESGAKVGNFVETKKAHIGQGAKVSHLSYVGDAEVGEGSNIGCGFITCNYDGKNKHQTKIGKRSFIGSDSQVVAPVEIGDDCFVACGSTITQDMPSGSFAVSRGRQQTKAGMAKKFLKS